MKNSRIFLQNGSAAYGSKSKITSATLRKLLRNYSDTSDLHKNSKLHSTLSAHKVTCVVHFQSPGILLELTVSRGSRESGSFTIPKTG